MAYKIKKQRKYFKDSQYEKAEKFAEKVDGEMYLSIFKGQPITVIYKNKIKE